MEGKISTSIIGKIATVSFFHPAGNSFPSDQLNKLTEEISLLGKNKEITLIVLKSEGEGAFCAGASFDELLSVTDIHVGSRFFSGFAKVINAMRKCPKIIVGKAHGKAVGGGVGLLAACDYVFANKKADIKLSELAIGIGPFVIEPVVSRKIGKTAIGELSLDPFQWKSASWAYEKGLYSRLFENDFDLDEEIEKYTQKVSRLNPEALAEMKKVLWEGTEDWDTLLFERANISGKLVLSDFTKEALLQFKKQ